MAVQIGLQLRDGVALVHVPDGAAPGDLASLLTEILAPNPPRALVLALDGALEGAPFPPLLAQISQSPCPVFAASNAALRGSALSLALAARWRIVGPNARISADEPSKGLIPQAILPLARRIGAGPTLKLLLEGGALAPAEAQAVGLIDAVVERGDLVAAVFSLARQVAGGAVLPERAPDAGLSDPKTYLADLRAAPLGEVAPALRQRCLEVVEAALLLPAPAAETLAQEAIAEAAAAPLARALAAHDRARARAKTLARLPRQAPLTRFGIWLDGSPTAALTRLAIWALCGGELVVGSAQTHEIEEIFAAIARVLGPQGSAPDPRALNRLRAASGASDMAEVEAILLHAPSADLLRALAASVAPILPAAVPRIVLGASALGFWGMRLGAQTVELDLPQAADPARAAALAQMFTQGGAIVLRGSAGIAMRMQAALFIAAERAALKGADPVQVDRALAGLFAEGPFKRAERAGGRTMAQLFALSTLPMGPFWAEFAAGLHSDTALYGPKIAARFAQLRPAEPKSKPLTQTEIVTRVMAELAGEGARLLQNAGAQRASDIDLVMVLETGLTPRAGGPMHWADQTGPALVRKTLRALEAEGAPAPAALWDGLIRNAKRFADLDAD